MDTKLEIQRLRHRVQELEQENAELRARLATFDPSGPAPGKDNGATSSKRRGLQTLRVHQTPVPVPPIYPHQHAMPQAYRLARLTLPPSPA